MKKYNFIDLFSGAGGLALGFEMAGFENIFSLDFEKSFNETYKANFPNHNLLEIDIKKLKETDIKKILENKKVDVIVGGPPCQGFSMAGNVGRKFIDDERNNLYKEFIRIVKNIKPKSFVMENVARLFTHKKGQTKNDIIKDFENIGYKVECKILNSADYGVAQLRRRTIFIGTKNTLKKEVIFPKKTTEKYLTIKEVIDDLPKLKSGETCLFIKNHSAMKHSNQMLEKMKYVKDGQGREDIPKNIRPTSGDIRKYIRYNSKKPSITITGDMRKVFHYYQNRALTVRELARIQSFPDNFIFKGSVISQQQQIGNSVPPLMAYSIAQTVKENLKNYEK